MEKKNAQPRKDPVIQEWPAVGKYRVRLIGSVRHPDAEPTLDIREYVQAESFEGFTRRGVRLAGRTQWELLRNVLSDALGRAAFLVPAPRPEETPGP